MLALRPHPGDVLQGAVDTQDPAVAGVRRAGRAHPDRPAGGGAERHLEVERRSVLEHPVDRGGDERAAVGRIEIEACAQIGPVCGRVELVDAEGHWRPEHLPALAIRLPATDPGDPLDRLGVHDTAALLGHVAQLHEDRAGHRARRPFQPAHRPVAEAAAQRERRPLPARQGRVETGGEAGAIGLHRQIERAGAAEIADVAAERMRERGIGERDPSVPPDQAERRRGRVETGRDQRRLAHVRAIPEQKITPDPSATASCRDKTSSRLTCI